VQRIDDFRSPNFSLAGSSKLKFGLHRPTQIRLIRKEAVLTLKVQRIDDFRSPNFSLAGSSKLKFGLHRPTKIRLIRQSTVLNPLY